MTFIVPAVLFAIAIGLITFFSRSAAKARAEPPQVNDVPSQAKILIHSINDDRCTGCDACVAVCPTNVLDLVENKSRVLRFEDCIQCEACQWACPTEALVMHLEGTQPPPVKVPDIDSFYQTRVAGQYLIGEVAGKPLVKNAANLGRAVVEHMIQGGLKARPPAQDSFDVLIVGSGPGGLAAALSCRQHGLSYLILEKENVIASTVARYPKGKLIMAEPYNIPNLSLLPVFDSSKEEMIPLWQSIIERLAVNIRMHETVNTVKKPKKKDFKVETSGGTYAAQRVILATGTRGKPRTLGVVGEELPKVESLLDDPDSHRGKSVCVVGGGDSALEAAVALADAGASVILSYRGRSFHRAQAKNRKTIESYEKRRRIKVKLQTEVAEFKADSVTIRGQEGTHKKYPNDAAFVLIGSDPPVKWLASLGVHYVERPHMLEMKSTDQLVRDFLPGAMECPADVSSAVAQVLGQDFPKQVAEAPSVGRKFIRAASSLFGIGDGDFTGLADNAGEARRRHHTGQGRRDDLKPEERTRVLRMLRDEGGRKADEESHLEVLGGPGYEPPPMPAPVPPHRQGIVEGLNEARNAYFNSSQDLTPPADFEERPTKAVSPIEAENIVNAKDLRAQGNNLATYLDAPSAPANKEVDLSSLLSGNTMDDEEVDEDKVDHQNFDDEATNVASPDLLAKIRSKPPAREKKKKFRRSISQIDFDLDGD